MASTFELVRNAVAVDLLQAENAGWRGVQWRPRTALTTGNRMPPLVTETVDILADATSHDVLSVDFQDMDNYRWLAREYVKDRTQEHPVWLHAQMENETGERRALVHNISMAWQTEEVDKTDQDVCANQARIRAQITRGPFWEDTAANTKTVGSNVSIFAGAYDYSGADVVGDAPARIASLQLSSDGTTDAYTRAWIGFRSANKHGTLANFEPLWECEDFSGSSGDVALAADATASPGGGGNTKATCDFSGTADWLNRIKLELSDVYTTNYSDMYGRFVILLRAKVGATTTCEVKLRHHVSWGDSEFYDEGPIVEVSSTSWTIHNLGTFTIPIRDLHAFPLATWIDDYDEEDQFWLWARRTSGSNDLDMDCFMVIPADELFMYVDGMSSEGGAVRERAVVTQSPEGLWHVMSWRESVTSYWYAAGTIAPQGLGVPVGDGRMYCVMATSTNTNTLADTYDATMSLFPRWYNLRGAE